MADDARISTALPRHPKTVKLQRRLGAPGCWSLLCLFLWVAENRPTGDLGGMTGEDIEIAATWPGPTGDFVRTLAEVRFLDGQEGAYKIHDWAEHNPWAANRPGRIEKARAAAGARWERKRASEPNAASMQCACSEHDLAMPTSPHLTTPPDTTRTLPPSQEIGSVLLEKTARAHARDERYTQVDFDERDLRLLAEGEAEIVKMLKHGWGKDMTEDQIFAEVCVMKGITVERGLDLRRRAKQYPAAQTVGAA